MGSQEGCLKGGSLGRGVGGGVSDGVPEKGLVGGDGLEVNASFDLAHFNDRTSVRMVREEALEAAVAYCGGLGGGASGALGGAGEGGVIGDHCGRLLEQRGDATYVSPLGDSGGLGWRGATRGRMRGR